MPGSSSIDLANHFSSNSASSAAIFGHSILSGTILQLCISFLSLREVLKVSGVSHSWHQSVDSKLVWNTITKPVTDSSLINLDKVWMMVQLPLKEHEWKLWTTGSKIEHTMTWRAYTSQLLKRLLNNSNQYWLLRQLRTMLQMCNVLPAAAAASTSLLRPWLASTILRRHLPIEVVLPPSGICQSSPHVSEELLRAQALALKQLSAFGNIYSLTIDLDVDDGGSWVSQILSLPATHRVHHFTRLPPSVWGDAVRLKLLATKLPSLEQIYFGSWRCQTCRRYPLQATLPCHTTQPPSNSPSVPTKADLRLFSKARVVLLEDIVEWDQWTCLSALTELRVLQVLQGMHLPPLAHPTINLDTFTSIPRQLGLHQLLKLNLGCSNDIAQVSAGMWMDFLKQLPQLQWLRVEGASLASFTQALAKVSHQLPKLREVRWVITTPECTRDFCAKECGSYLKLVSESFEDDGMIFRVIVPSEPDFALLVDGNVEYDIHLKICELSDQNIPRISLDWAVEDDELGYEAIVKDEDGKKLY